MLLMGTAGWLVLNWLDVHSWLTFFTLAAAYTVLYWAFAYFFMMNDYEKNFVKTPLRKVLSRLKNGKER